MSYQPIENYGIIGNMRTVALVGMNGSIDWYCYPHFDSPSIFGALLDDVKGGRFQISPIGDPVRHKQFYWPSTNILITRFLLADGSPSYRRAPVMQATLAALSLLSSIVAQPSGAAFWWLIAGLLLGSVLPLR